jgi:hypothetical protein
MKLKNLLLPILLFVSMIIKSQIPNPGFETLSGSIPAQWNTGPVYSYYTIKDTAVAKTGNHAALMYGFVPPASGAIVKDFPNYSIAKPIALTGWFKFYPQLGDSILFDIEIWKQGSYSTRGKNSKFTSAITSSTSVYTQFSIPITYAAPMAYCDSAWISIYPSGNVSALGYNWPHPNTIVMVDDLQWVYLTVGMGIDEEVLNVENVYPNPSKNIVNVIYTVPSKHSVSIKVYDVKGNLVETVINDETQVYGRYKAEVDISWLISGAYFIEITNGSELRREKIIVD